LGPDGRRPELGGAREHAAPGGAARGASQGGGRLPGAGVLAPERAGGPTRGARGGSASAGRGSRWRAGERA
jgi:hypothetical protein